MAIPTLMKVLTTCYGGKMRSHTMFTTILKKKLPPSLTTTQGQELGERLVVRCIFPPSLAEILEEWRLMQSESRRPEKAALPEWTKQSLCPSVRRQIEDVKERIRRREPAPFRPIPGECWAFVRSVFPEITETQVRQNLMEIRNCMDDQKQQRRTGDPYRTLMRLTEDGNIELFMCKVRREGETASSLS